MSNKMADKKYFLRNMVASKFFVLLWDDILLDLVLSVSYAGVRKASRNSKYAIQYSCNSTVSIILVSLLSRVSGLLRTALFHFFRNVFTLVCIINTSRSSDKQLYANAHVNQNVF